MDTAFLQFLLVVGFGFIALILFIRKYARGRRRGDQNLTLKRGNAAQCGHRARTGPNVQVPDSPSSATSVVRPK